MSKKAVSGIMLTLLFIGMLTLAFNIQQVKASGTIYIRANGSVHPPTAPISSVDNITYTLTNNIVGDVPVGSSAVVVERDNIVVDGAGYAVQGTRAISSKGVSLPGRSNIIIKNIEIMTFFYGIYLYESSNNTLSGNNVTNNESGIYLSSASNNSIYENNVTTNNRMGIRLYHSSNNSIYRNNIYANNYSGTSFCSSGIWLYESSHNSIYENNMTNNDLGIWLDKSSKNVISGNAIKNNCNGTWLRKSSNNVFRSNSMANKHYNFGVSGPYDCNLADFVNDIDTSNTVDGKPVYYWINKRAAVVPLNAGYVALINCTSITVQNLKLTKNGQGVLLAYTTNSTISGNTITDISAYGILLYYSQRNTISGNEVANTTCGEESNGILLVCSCNNSVCGNNVTENQLGIQLEYHSNHNSIFGNSITSSNWYGIELNGYSSYNSIYENTITNNDIDGIAFYGRSSYNNLYRNTITNNNVGFHMAQGSSNNDVYHNNFINNTVQAFVEERSVNVWDDGYPSGGNYWSDYTGADMKSGPSQDQPGSDGIGDTPYMIDANNTDRYPLMDRYKPHMGPYDIGISRVTPSKNIIGQGFTLYINVRIKNYGNYTENSSVTVYYNTINPIATQTVTLSSGNSTTITFAWNTTGIAKSNYTLSAYAEPVPGETDTADNTLTDGIVTLSIPGDVDGDLDVDLYDAVKICAIYGSEKGDPKYVPNRDINGDGKINIYDLVITCIHYGQKDP